jgi:serine/threonine-protein kinase
MSALLPEGMVFAGRYRVVRRIASGGMGAVYEVVQLETERRRALKVMHPHLFQSEEMRQRFKRESKIAAQVESEHIVDVFDAGVDEATGTPYLVMELLRGEELGDRLKRCGRLPAAEVLTYLEQAARALDRTHQASIVHRDLKPENLFVTCREDGSPRIKILDFGVAKLVAEGATSAGATRSLGTPLYMAPEQFRSNSRLGSAADIYALGMMAFTLLVGEPYWAAEARASGDVIAFAMTVIRGPVDSAVARAHARGVALPPAFDGWFSRVTANDPGDRFPTASEAVRALQAVMASSLAAPALAMPPAFSTSMPAALTPVSLGAALTPSGSVPRFSGTPSSPGFPAPTMTLANSGVTHAPLERGRASLVVSLAVLALGILGTAVWTGLRAQAPASVASAASGAVAASVETASPRVEPPAASVAPSAVSAPVVSAPVVTAVSAAAPVVSAPVLRPAPVGTPAASASADAGKLVKPGAKAGAPAPGAKAPSKDVPLLGRE